MPWSGGCSTPNILPRRVFDPKKDQCPLRCLAASGARRTRARLPGPLPMSGASQPLPCPTRSRVQPLHPLLPVYALNDHHAIKTWRSVMSGGLRVMSGSFCRTPRGPAVYRSDLHGLCEERRVRSSRRTRPSSNGRIRPCSTSAMQAMGGAVLSGAPRASTPVRRHQME